MRSAARALALGCAFGTACDLSDLTSGWGGSASVASSSGTGGLGSSSSATSGAGGCTGEGPFAWAARLPGPESQRTRDGSSIRIAEDASGGFFVIAATSGVVTFGGTALGSEGSVSLLLAHYDEAGTVTAAQAHAVTGTLDAVRVEDAIVLADGRLAVAGTLGNATLVLRGPAQDVPLPNTDEVKDRASFVATFSPALLVDVARKLESEADHEEGVLVHALATEGNELFVGGEYTRNVSVYLPNAASGTRLVGMTHEESEKNKHGFVAVFDLTLGYLRGTSFDGAAGANVAVRTLALAEDRVFAVGEIDVPTTGTVAFRPSYVLTGTKIVNDAFVAAVSRTQALPTAWVARVGSGATPVVDRPTGALHVAAAPRLWLVGTRSGDAQVAAEPGISFLWPAATSSCRFPVFSGKGDGWVVELADDAIPTCRSATAFDRTPGAASSFDALVQVPDPDGNGPAPSAIWSVGTLRLQPPLSSYQGPFETTFANDVSTNALLATFREMRTGPADVTIEASGAAFGGVAADVLVDDLVVLRGATPSLLIAGSTPDGFFDPACDPTVNWDYVLLRRPM